MNVLSSIGFWHFLIGSKVTVKVKAEHLAQLMAEELRPFEPFKGDERALGALKDLFCYSSVGKSLSNWRHLYVAR